MSKIYIETEMNEMPKGCNECPKCLSCRDVESNTYDFAECRHQTKRGHSVIKHYLAGTRPEWCPFVELPDDIKEIYRGMR
jgi:Fe-S-cluster containining protein